ncbi:MAG: phytoene/squalene synthase family protein [Verrucomicrobiaceae bacterium]|jgi:phytoene synthase
MNTDLQTNPLGKAADPASSTEIAIKSKSNLALALACLPRERRRDMVSFYAFCRIVDDIADDPELPEATKRASLARWREAVLGGDAGQGDPVQAEVVGLPVKYGFSPQWLAEIIDGVASDQDKIRYANLEELKAYCYKVACVVGLVSARIFGARDARSDEYAVTLGYALQLTNIMRDIGEDARECGRIYLPADELARFGVSEQDILQGRYSPEFLRLMNFQYQRARRYYEEASALLPTTDRHRMVAARMMARIYGDILEKLKHTGFRVFDRREKLSKLHKGVILGGYLMHGWLHRADSR